MKTNFLLHKCFMVSYLFQNGKRKIIITLLLLFIYFKNASLKNNMHKTAISLILRFYADYRIYISCL